MQRFAELTVPMMDFGDAAYRREIFRSASQYQLQLGERVIELIELDEGAPERDARGKIARVDRETGAAGVDSFLTLPGAPQFFGELRKCNRRRILLDPASKIVDALVVGHPPLRNGDLDRGRSRAARAVGHGEPNRVVSAQRELVLSRRSVGRRGAVAKVPVPARDRGAGRC